MLVHNKSTLFYTGKCYKSENNGKHMIFPPNCNNGSKRVCVILAGFAHESLTTQKQITIIHNSTELYRRNVINI